MATYTVSGGLGCDSGATPHVTSRLLAAPAIPQPPAMVAPSKVLTLTRPTVAAVLLAFTNLREL